MKKKYTYIRMNGKKIRTHRLVMQEAVGRELESSEHVYHLNGDSLDNRIENLVVIKKKYKDES